MPVSLAIPGRRTSSALRPRAADGLESVSVKTAPPEPRTPRRKRQRTDAPGTWLLLASTAAAVEAHAEQIRDLFAAGHVVRLGWTSGRLPRDLPQGRHRLGTFRIGPGRLVSRVLTLPLSTRRTLDLAARHDRWLSEVAGVADDVVLTRLAASHLGARVRELAPRPGTGRRRRPAGCSEEAAWRSPRGRVPASSTTGSRTWHHRAGAGPAETLDELEATGPCGWSWPVTCGRSCCLARWALRRGGFDRVDESCSR